MTDDQAALIAAAAYLGPQASRLPSSGLELGPISQAAAEEIKALAALLTRNPVNVGPR